MDVLDQHALQRLIPSALRAANWGGHRLQTDLSVIHSGVSKWGSMGRSMAIHGYSFQPTLPVVDFSPAFVCLQLVGGVSRGFSLYSHGFAWDAADIVV